MSRSTILVVVLVLFQISAILTQAPRIRSYIENSQNELRSLFDNRDSRLDVERIYKNVLILSILHAEESLLKSEQLKSLRSFVPQTQAEAFYLSELASIVPESEIQLNKEEVKSQFKTNLNTEQSLESLYYTYFYLKRNSPNKNLTSSACENLKDFLNDDGTAKSSRKDSNGNYPNTVLLLELYNSCLESNKDLKNTLLKQLRKPVQSIFINTQEVGYDQLAFLEKAQTIQVTAALTKNLYLLTESVEEEFSNNFKKNYLIQLLKFVRDNEELTENINQRFEITRLYEALRKLPFVEVRQHPVLITKRTAEVLLSVGNLFGNFVGDQAQIIQSLRVSIQDRLGTPLEIESKVERNEKSPEFNFKIVFPKGVDVVGTYYLTLQQSNAKNQLIYKQTSKVVFVTQGRITSLQFEVVKGRVFPTSFSNRLREGEQIKENIQLNENNFVHINFKIETEKISSLLPSQVGLSVLHPNNKYTANFVPAKYDKSKDTWTVVLDLGDPDQILPYTNIYDAQIVVADRYLRDPIVWNFAKFHIQFKKVRSNPPPTDLDYEILPEIKHSFPAPIQQPPIFFISVFLLALFISFLYFLKQLKNLQINTLRLPENADKKLVVFIFIGALGILFGLLAYFWLFINIIQTLQILSVFVIPFFFLGNYAISSLRKLE